MKPNKEGQVVKFHTPFPDENPDQLYVILELHTDVEKPRAFLKELNGGLPFPSTKVVLVNELIVADISMKDLLGHFVMIEKSDSTRVEGKVVKIYNDGIVPDLTKSQDGVETNVLLSIIDSKGVEHRGTLFVRPNEV
ncbi:MAG: hypothetical protein ACOYO1_11215 [Bacteroidales bacterium]